jgi:hypothetical protein
MTSEVIAGPHNHRQLLLEGAHKATDVLSEILT